MCPNLYASAVVQHDRDTVVVASAGHAAIAGQAPKLCTRRCNVIALGGAYVGHCAGRLVSVSIIVAWMICLSHSIGCHIVAVLGASIAAAAWLDGNGLRRRWATIVASASSKEPATRVVRWLGSGGLQVARSRAGVSKPKLRGNTVVLYFVQQARRSSRSDAVSCLDLIVVKASGSVKLVSFGKHSYCGDVHGKTCRVFVDQRDQLSDGLVWFDDDVKAASCELHHDAAGYRACRGNRSGCSDTHSCPRFHCILPSTTF